MQLVQEILHTLDGLIDDGSNDGVELVNVNGTLRLHILIASTGNHAGKVDGHDLTLILLSVLALILCIYCATNQDSLRLLASPAHLANLALVEFLFLQTVNDRNTLFPHVVDHRFDQITVDHITSNAL